MVHPVLTSTNKFNVSMRVEEIFPTVTNSGNERAHIKFTYGPHKKVNNGRNKSFKMFVVQENRGSFEFTPCKKLDNNSQISMFSFLSIC